MSTLVKMPHCWKSHVTAHMSFILIHIYYTRDLVMKNTSRRVVDRVRSSTPIVRTCIGCVYEQLFLPFVWYWSSNVPSSACASFPQAKQMTNFL